MSVLSPEPVQSQQEFSFNPFTGENLGVNPQDLFGLLLCGGDCLLTAEWKSPNKIVALCPGGAKEGKGDIIVATKSGGIGTWYVKGEKLGLELETSI